jgi:putative transposase
LGDACPNSQTPAATRFRLIEYPVYFLTLCTAGRRPALANEAAVAVLRAEFESAPSRYGWSVGRFVAMPDHLHFFCVSDETPNGSSLSRFMAGFKQWTAKGILRATSLAPPFWQKEFFDHACARTKAMSPSGVMFERTQCGVGS